jgi:hypothetical protein
MHITINGKTDTIKNWAKYFNIKVKEIKTYLDQNNIKYYLKNVKDRNM